MIDKETQTLLFTKMKEICTQAQMCVNDNNEHQRTILFRIHGMLALTKVAVRKNEPESVLIFLLSQAKFSLNHLKDLNSQ